MEPVKVDLRERTKDFALSVDIGVVLDPGFSGDKQLIPGSHCKQKRDMIGSSLKLDWFKHSSFSGLYDDLVLCGEKKRGKGLRDHGQLTTRRGVVAGSWEHGARHSWPAVVGRVRPRANKEREGRGET